MGRIDEGRIVDLESHHGPHTQPALGNMASSQRTHGTTHLPEGVGLCKHPTQNSKNARRQCWIEILQCTTPHGTGGCSYQARKSFGWLHRSWWLKSSGGAPREGWRFWCSGVASLRRRFGWPRWCSSAAPHPYEGWRFWCSGVASLRCPCRSWCSGGAPHFQCAVDGGQPLKHFHLRSTPRCQEDAYSRVGEMKSRIRMGSSLVNSRVLITVTVYAS